MKKWRPKDWKNPNDEYHNAFDIPTVQDAEWEAYEAGADAMLEALKNNCGLYGEMDTPFPFDHPLPITYDEEPVFTDNGWLVFIPRGS